MPLLAQESKSSDLLTNKQAQELAMTAKSIVVASTATRQAGQEAAIFKGVFVHSIAARVPWSCWPMLTCSPRSFHDGSEVRVSHR